MVRRRRFQPPISLLTLTAVFFIVGICRAEYYGGDMTRCSSDAVPYLLSVSATGHPAHQRHSLVARKGASDESIGPLDDGFEYFDDGKNSEEGRRGDERRHRHHLDDESLPEVLDNSVNRGSKRWRSGRAQQQNVALPSFSADAYDNSADDSSREEELNYFNDDGAALRRRFVRAASLAAPPFAECDTALAESACAASGEWTGAVAEWNNGTHISLRMSCCQYAPLRDGSLSIVELKSVELRAGQQYRGGTVLDGGGHAVAFDLVKEVRKNVTETNEVVYIVKVFRIGCTNSAEDKGRTDDFFVKNRESALQTNRLQPSASMVRIAMSKRKSAPLTSSRSTHSYPHTYLQQVRLAAAKAASRRPKFHRFPYYRRPLDDSASLPSSSSSAVSDRSNPDNDGHELREDGERSGLSSSTERRRHPSSNDAVTRSPLLMTVADAPPTPPPTSQTSANHGPRRRMPSTGQSQELSGGSSSSARRRFQQYQLQQRARARNATAGSAPPKRSRVPLAPPTYPALSSAGGSTASDYEDAISRRSGAGRRVSLRHEKVYTQKQYSSDERGETSASHEQLWPLRFMAPNGIAQRSRQYAVATNEDSGSAAPGAPGTFDAEEEQNNLRATDEEYQLAENAAGAGTGLVPPSTNSLASSNEQQQRPETDQPEQQLQEQPQYLGQPAPQILTDELTQPSLPVYQQGSYPTYLPQPPPPTQVLSGNDVSSYQAPPAVFSPSSVDYQQSQYVVEQQQCSSTCTGPTPTYCPSGGGGGRCCCNNLNAGLNNLFSSLQCFSGDQLVRTRDGHKRMDELRVGDLVLSIDQSMITYSPIVMFLHRKPSERASFLRVETRSAHRITMTDFHLIYASSGPCESGVGGAPIRLVAARHLRVGDCVHVVSYADRRLLPTRVTRIETVEDVGIYAPLTASGDIFVGEVLASCHSNFAAQTLQQTFFAAWRSMEAWAYRVRRLANSWLGERDTLLFGWWHFRNNLTVEEEAEHPTGCKPAMTRWMANDTRSAANVPPGEWTTCERGVEPPRMMKRRGALRKDEDAVTEIPFGVEYLVGMLEMLVPISGF